MLPLGDRMQLLLTLPFAAMLVFSGPPTAASAGSTGEEARAGVSNRGEFIAAPVAAAAAATPAPCRDCPVTGEVGSAAGPTPSFTPGSLADGAGADDDPRKRLVEVVVSCSGECGVASERFRTTPPGSGTSRGGLLNSGGPFTCCTGRRDVVEKRFKSVTRPYSSCGLPSTATAKTSKTRQQGQGQAEVGLFLHYTPIRARRDGGNPTPQKAPNFGGQQGLPKDLGSIGQRCGGVIEQTPCTVSRIDEQGTINMTAST